MPDVMVVPTCLTARASRSCRCWRSSAKPLPLVVEVWSPSTGDYDVETKIPVYQQRGDLDIWRLHPYEPSLARWVRQTDGSYAESTHQGGVIELAALPGVTIDLDRLFAG